MQKELDIASEMCYINCADLVKKYNRVIKLYNIRRNRMSKPGSDIQSNQGRYCLNLTPEEFQLIVRLVRLVDGMNKDSPVNSLKKKFQALDPESY